MADRTWPGAGEGRGLSTRTLACATLFVSLLGFGGTMLAQAAEPAVVIPVPALDPAPPAGNALQTIVLAGGCFWGPQLVYEHVNGVTQALSGYAGGQKATAHAEIVGTATTDDAEWVRLTFDPRQISLGKILRIYFSVAHNPTEFNYQGPDVGTQYRSEIFYANDEQKRIAEAYIAQLNTAHVFAQAIITEVEAWRSLSRPQATIRTLPSCIRTNPTSCPMICRRLQTSSAYSPITIARRRSPSWRRTSPSSDCL